MAATFVSLTQLRVSVPHASAPQTVELAVSNGGEASAWGHIRGHAEAELGASHNDNDDGGGGGGGGGGGRSYGGSAARCAPRYLAITPTVRWCGRYGSAARYTVYSCTYIHHYWPPALEHSALLTTYCLLLTTYCLLLTTYYLLPAFALEHSALR